MREAKFKTGDLVVWESGYGVLSSSGMHRITRTTQNRCYIKICSHETHFDICTGRQIGKNLGSIRLATEEDKIKFLHKMNCFKILDFFREHGTNIIKMFTPDHAETILQVISGVLANQNE